MGLDNSPMDLNDNMVKGMEDNSSNMSGPTSNISPRGQENLGFGGDIDVHSRTSFSVDVQPFKSLEPVSSFSQPDMGKVYESAENNQVYNTGRDIDGFSNCSDVGQGYSQTEAGYSQVFSSGTDTSLAYTQSFTAPTEPYTTGSDAEVNFSQNNISNIIELKSVTGEQSNICKVFVTELFSFFKCFLFVLQFFVEMSQTEKCKYFTVLND